MVFHPVIEVNMQTSLLKSCVFSTTEAKAVFDEYDKDGNGYIDESELGTALQRLGLNPSQREIQSMIGEVDSDGKLVIQLKAALAVFLYLFYLSKTYIHEK